MEVLAPYDLILITLQIPQLPSWAFGNFDIPDIYQLENYAVPHTQQAILFSPKKNNRYFLIFN